MEIFADLNRFKLVHGSCIEVLNVSGSDSCTSIIADWQFDNYTEILKDVVYQSKRVLSSGGSFLSIHYPDCNHNVRNVCEEAGLTYYDEVYMKMGVTYVLNKHQLPKQSLSILVMGKGSLESRRWKGIPEEAKPMMFNAESLGVPTTTWYTKQIRNGFKNKFIGAHEEAMPKWLVHNMIDQFVPSNGNVLDLFGGAGNVLMECRARNIPCISSELKEENCELISKRLQLNV